MNSWIKFIGVAFLLFTGFAYAIEPSKYDKYLEMNLAELMEEESKIAESKYYSYLGAFEINKEELSLMGVTNLKDAVHEIPGVFDSKNYQVTQVSLNGEIVTGKTMCSIFESLTISFKEINKIVVVWQPVKTSNNKSNFEGSIDIVTSHNQSLLVKL